jgi:hypothetical protein
MVINNRNNFIILFVDGNKVLVKILDIKVINIYKDEEWK